jgi:hypothetical protein
MSKIEENVMGTCLWYSVVILVRSATDRAREFGKEVSVQVNFRENFASQFDYLARYLV